jgi:two-component system CheB/CheR fusion protein
MQDVVGLGGSAESIEALKTFFSYMPEDSGLAFVVVLHLSPKYESSLEVVLQKWTSMPK